MLKCFWFFACFILVSVAATAQKGKGGGAGTGHLAMPGHLPVLPGLLPPQALNRPATSIAFRGDIIFDMGPSIIRR